ncbi:hypothetical protein cypCar_00012875, partial [Cyprinus carpio]
LYTSPFPTNPNTGLVTSNVASPSYQIIRSTGFQKAVFQSLDSHILIIGTEIIMAAEGNLVSGGVMLLHTESEGKHSYEVKGFLNYNKGTFASNGDKLIMINNKYMEDLTPRAFAELLVEGSPSLTIHHSPKRKTEECESEEISVHTKEPTVMRFSLMMVREEDLEATGVEPSPEWESEDIEDDCFSDDNLLLVSMAGTRFSMVVPRGCDPVNPCNCCGGMNCQFNEVVVLPATAEITFNSSMILKRVTEQTNVILKSVLMGKYVTPENQWMFLRDTMSAKITLYYYTATMGREGVPVVLNFTGTENFFCCTTKQGEDKKILTLVASDIKKSTIQRQGSHVLISIELNMAAENVHHPSTEETEECESEDTRCNKKLKFIRFSLSIEDTEIGGHQEPSDAQAEGEEKDIEDDCFGDDDLLHSLANMSLNLVVDQDSDADNPFCNCDRQFKESVIKSEKADISYISAQIWKVIKEQKSLFLKTREGCKYVASRQNEICLESTMSAKITIFQGTFRGMVTNDSESGVPIVLNFTGTDNFLSCTSKGEEKILTVKTYDRKKISADDPEKSSLIFYMSQKRDGLRYFESALYRGWFIHTINDIGVKMQRGNNAPSSCFVIERE